METIKIRTNTLAGEIKNYKFYIQKHRDKHVIRIPGHGGGYDGPYHADHPEQEKWLRSFEYLLETWHLTWECNNTDNLRKLLKAIEKLEK
jgi:hypothetical protein